MSIKNSDVQHDIAEKSNSNVTEASPPNGELDTTSHVTNESDSPDDHICVGAGGKLIVPHEDIGDDTDAGEELDLTKLRKEKFRKPGRREWFALKLDSELTVRLLIHKPKADGIETEHYYVQPDLRAAIRDELKAIRVFLYVSFTTNEYALWPMNVTLDNSWYESIVPLFKQPTEFFIENEIRVVSDKPNSRYKIKFRPLRSSVTWPDRPTDELLGEALGEEHFITSPDHELYQELIAGVVL